MVSAIKQTVTVQKGGVVQVRSGDLIEGATAEVIVLMQSAAAKDRRSLASFVGASRRSFNSLPDVDAFVRELRDEWDR